MDEISVKEVNPAQWDDVIANLPGRTVFHSSEWLNTIKASHGASPVLLQIVHRDQCLAAWPCLVMKKGPLRIVGSPLPGWSTAYMGPLFYCDADVRVCLRAFFSHPVLRRQSYLACKTIDHCNVIDLSEFGCSKVMNLETYVIDLTLSTETLWANCKSECRSRIRKAERLHIEVRKEGDDRFLPDYWSMSVETFQRSNIHPTYSCEFVREMWNRLAPIEMAHAFSAFMDGVRVATLVMLCDHRAMYYWGGASRTSIRHVPVHNLLHWRAIGWAQERGLCEYDFISTLGGPGRFKRTFGPKTVAVGTHWERSGSRVLALLKDRYEKYLHRQRRVDASAVPTS